MAKFICTYCNIFVFDSEKGEPRARLEPGTTPDQIPESWTCPVCGQKKHYLKDLPEEQWEEKKSAFDRLFPTKGKEIPAEPQTETGKDSPPPDSVKPEPKKDAGILQVQGTDQTLSQRSGQQS